MSTVVCLSERKLLYLRQSNSQDRVMALDLMSFLIHSLQYIFDAYRKCGANNLITILIFAYHD